MKQTSSCHILLLGPILLCLLLCNRKNKTNNNNNNKKNPSCLTGYMPSYLWQLKIPLEMYTKIQFPPLFPPGILPTATQNKVPKIKLKQQAWLLDFGRHCRLTGTVALYASFTGWLAQLSMGSLKTVVPITWSTELHI